MGRIGNAIDESLDFVGHVRNDLNRFAQICARALVMEDVPVYFSRRQVGIPVQILVDESLIMP